LRCRSLRARPKGRRRDERCQKGGPVKKIACLALLVGAFACGSKSGDKAAEMGKPAGGASLYDRLGGKDAIAVVVNDFVANCGQDDLIKARFANTDFPAFKQKLVEQICQATGGPCTYTGKNMKEAHAGMKISDAEFTALVGDLKKALVKNKVPDREQTELLTALGGMHDDIVNQ
jgi:hemoglobin